MPRKQDSRRRRSKYLMKKEPQFCHDFQNGTCRRHDSCRFIHCRREDEDQYKLFHRSREEEDQYSDRSREEKNPYRWTSSEKDSERNSYADEANRDVRDSLGQHSQNRGDESEHLVAQRRSHSDIQSTSRSAAEYEHDRDMRVRLAHNRENDIENLNPDEPYRERERRESGSSGRSRRDLKELEAEEYNKLYHKYDDRRHGKMEMSPVNSERADIDLRPVIEQLRQKKNMKRQRNELDVGPENAGLRHENGHLLGRGNEGPQPLPQENRDEVPLPENNEFDRRNIEEPPPVNINRAVEDMRRENQDLELLRRENNELRNELCGQFEELQFLRPENEKLQFLRPENEKLQLQLKEFRLNDEMLPLKIKILRREKDDLVRKNEELHDKNKDLYQETSEIRRKYEEKCQEIIEIRRKYEEKCQETSETGRKDEETFQEIPETRQKDEDEKASSENEGQRQLRRQTRSSVAKMKRNTGPPTPPSYPTRSRGKRQQTGAAVTPNTAPAEHTEEELN